MESNNERSIAPETAPYLSERGINGTNDSLSSTSSEGKGPRNVTMPEKSLGISQSQRSQETSPSPSGYSHVSPLAVHSAEHGAHHSDDAIQLTPTPRKVSSNPWQAHSDWFWLEYRGVVLMILSQLFGAMMSTTARYLETMKEGVEPMSTFQVLFVRMSVTVVASFVYMWWAKVPDAPFGARAVRGLLIARGFGGFFGVFGLYYSLIYLPLAEATVITFLAPLLAAWICSALIKTPFTRIHKIAGFISLGGVVLIAQPFHFVSPSSVPEDSSSLESVNLLNRATANQTSVSPPSGSTLSIPPGQRAAAVGVALLGVCGAACAYTTISWIGKRAHPLISMNYFATWCTFVSTVVLIFYPGQKVRLPVGWREWLLIVFLGCSGFVMQFLMTSALSHDRNRAIGLNMVYTQMLFALAMDKLVWGTTPGATSIVGSSMILGSAIWVAVAKERGGKENVRRDAGRTGQTDNDEEAGLVEGMEGNEEEENAGGTQGEILRQAHVVGEDDDDDEDIELKEMAER